MTPPDLTPEQRAAAVAKAIEVRRVRAEVKARIRSGELTFAEVLELATDPMVGGIKLSSIIESFPRMGKVTTKRLMARLEISDARRLQGILNKTHQRQALLDELS